MGSLQNATGVHRCLQNHMRDRGLRELDPVTAGALLGSVRILRDSRTRPGLPLRNLLRAGLIPGAYQVPNTKYGRWHIPLLTSGKQPEP